MATPEQPASSGVPLWTVLLAVVVLLVLLAALVPAALRTRDRRRRLAAVDAGGPDAAGAAWAEILAESTDRGVPAAASDTVRAGARRLVREHQLDDDAQQALREVVGAVEASWYGGGQPAAGELAGPVGAVREGITAGRSLTLRERLLPRSTVIDVRLPGRGRTDVTPADEDARV